MRILLVSPVLPHRPCHDARRLFASQLIDHLSGHHAVAVVAAPGPADTAMARAWLTARAAPVEIVAAHRWRRPSLRALADGLRRAVAVFQPDVIHLEGALLAPLSRVTSAPCVLAYHDAPAARARDAGRGPAPAWRRLGARLAERRERGWVRTWFDGVSACVVDSEHDRRTLGAELPFERIEVISSGIDAEAYAYRRVGDPGRLVFTGDLDVATDVRAARRLATSILPALRRQIPRADLVIASTGSAEPARELSRLPGVRVEARLPDLRPTVRGAAVYVSPVATGAGRAARLLEPLALGTPVVASAASLSRLDAVVPGHHALTADADADVADAIALLMREPVVANTLARNARALVERSFTWRAVTRRYEDVYRRLVARPMERAA